MTIQALTYRPTSHIELPAAFTAAVTIYFSAIFFASYHHYLPAVSFTAPFTEIDFESTSPETVSQPAEVQPQTKPDTSRASDFVDISPVREIVRRPAISPVCRSSFAARRGIPGAIGPTVAIVAPRPEYPYEARRHHITGSGVAIVSVDPATGFVVDATMEQGTGNAILDHSALSAFRRWGFKPGVPAKVVIPITFTMAGAQL
jgi:TonB family protein